ncbi:MAG: DUF1295 domain-containing protein [Mycobacterium sp.]
MNFLAVTLASLATIVVVFGITFAVGRRLGRYNVVDVTWGVGFVAVAATAAVAGTGDLTRRLLMLVLVAVWGARLAWHMYGKTRGSGEDPRYEALLGANPSTATVLRKVFLVQAAAAWFISLPIQVSAAAGPTPAILLPVLGLGVIVWLIGLVFEAVGDHQLKVFKADPAHRGVLMDRGLWSWTRHPNYFGDACIWWGVWLVSLSAWPALLTIVSPVAMTYLLVYGTGARLTEKHMADRPGLREYRNRVSFFLPRPPRRRV